MTNYTSPETLAKLRIVHTHAAMDMDDTIIIALIDALEEARRERDQAVHSIRLVEENRDGIAADYKTALEEARADRDALWTTVQIEWKKSRPVKPGVTGEDK